jgi:hypothetical protein
MEWAALITWVLTAGGGFVMLAIWLSRGGPRQQTESGDRIRPPRIFGHFGLAATGLVLWIIYIATDSSALAWIAFIVLVPVALLGWWMFFTWLGQRRRTPAAAAVAPATEPTGEAIPATATPAGPRGVPAEQHFPVSIVALHGLLAVTTVVLVLLTAIGVGESEESVRLVQTMF